MVKRNPVSTEQNIWSDSQQVDNNDLSLEQNFNNVVTSGIIDNHVGQGVLLESLEDNVLFDSSLVDGFLDGIALTAQNQPSDTNYGNQLEIELKHSKVAGKRNVKLIIIGLDFNSELQYETFVFKTNEVQYSVKHFVNILLILINDMSGNISKSFNLGGELTIKEAKPIRMSRDTIMVAQDVEPNLVFRDFFTATSTLQALLASALPLYNIDDLNIFTEVKDNKVLFKNDVSTQVGQKFKALTNNIQKLTLLLSVRNTEVGSETDLAWNGDLVVSIYPLQSQLDCITDVAPNLDIEFNPTNIPLAQISVSYLTLLEQGYELNGTAQPIDFVFSDTVVANGNGIEKDKFYAFTVKRSGSANKCDILVAVGNDRVDDSRVTIFNGILWTDTNEEDLWFKIYTDSAKMSDGQAYESGFGIILPKTKENDSTSVTEDYCLRHIPFLNNEVYTGVLFSSTDKTTPEPDQRTGEPQYTRQQKVPNIELLNTLDYQSLSSVTTPLKIGVISDKNNKYLDTSDDTIIANLHSFSLFKNELIVPIIDDISDTGRYDSTIIDLVTNFLNGNLVNSKVFPNGTDSTKYYRVAKAELVTMMYGDVNGDGIVDEKDVELLNSYLGLNFNSAPPTDSVITTDTITTTYTNGYSVYTKQFETGYSINFQVVDDSNNVIAAAADGTLVADPNDFRAANFTSSLVDFSLITNLSDCKLVILTNTNLGNYGAFDIVAIDANVISLRKAYIDGDVYLALLRADVNGDFVIDSTDGYILQSYIERENLPSVPSTPYPAPTTNPYLKIGKEFTALRIVFEKYVDRADEYTNSFTTRNLTVHPIQDIFSLDGYYASHDYYNLPVPIIFKKKLTWEDYLIAENSATKPVPSSFIFGEGFEDIKCVREGITYTTYPQRLDYDQGKVDHYFPGDVIVKGALKEPSGNFYKVDFEIGTIVLEIPNGLFDTEKTINVFENFIYEDSNGLTKSGFPALKFADCSYVQADALSNDQLRFSVAVQSFSPNTNGVDQDGYSGVIVDGKMGVYMNYTTGLLTLNFTNLYEDPTLQTLNTKVQVNVFLKKSGFNNDALFVNSLKVKNMLELISVFDGDNVGGPSAAPISSSTGVPDAGKVVKTDGYGLLDTSFYYLNPLIIPAVAGKETTTSTSAVDVGCLSFRFDKIISDNISSIVLECVLQTSSALDEGRVQLYSYADSGYVTLSGVNDYMATTSTTPEFLVSDDLQSVLNTSNADNVYEVRIHGTSGATITCKMARLVVYYNV